MLTDRDSMQIEEKYKDFFDKVKGFIDEQTRLKIKGTNDYNMVNVVRKETHEVGMHSNVIYSLIDPDGLHYQGDLFLNLFIKTVIKPQLGENLEFGDIISIHAEESTHDNRRIDFTIKSTNYLIGIEMKVDAKDLPQQVFDYYAHLTQERKNEQKVLIYYLTKTGEDANEISRYSKDRTESIEVKKISFRKDILEWIMCCKEAVKGISNLYISLENYENIVRKITNQYQGNLMPLEKYLLGDREKLSTEFSNILDEIETMQDQVVKNILDKCEKKLEDFMPKRQGNSVDVFINDLIIRLNRQEDRLVMQIGDKEDPGFSTIKDTMIKKQLVEKFEHIDKKFDPCWQWYQAYGTFHLGKVRLQTQDVILNKVLQYIKEIRIYIK